MTTAAAFLLATLTLLAAPGPTNALFAASGATVGVRRSLVLIPSAILGYVVTIGLLIGFVGPAAAAHPWLPISIKIVASVWLGWSAVTLWNKAEAASKSIGTVVSPQRILLTTLINPKTLIFAFVIFPQTGLGDCAPFALAFAAIVALTGLAWIGLGRSIARSSPRLATPMRIARTAAIVLGLFAAWIGTSAVAAALS